MKYAIHFINLFSAIYEKISIPNTFSKSLYLLLGEVEGGSRSIYPPPISADPHLAYNLEIKPMHCLVSVFMISMEVVLDRILLGRAGRGIRSSPHEASFNVQVGR